MQMDQKDMLIPDNPAHHGNNLTRLASEVTSVAAPMVAKALEWLDVISSGAATVAAIGGLYLLYLNIRRARRDLHGTKQNDT